MKTEQQFTAVIHFNLPEDAHVWLSNVVANKEDLKYRLQAKSKISVADAQASLLQVVAAINEALDA